MDQFWVLHRAHKAVGYPYHLGILLGILLQEVLQTSDATRREVNTIHKIDYNTKDIKLSGLKIQWHNNKYKVCANIAVQFVFYHFNCILFAFVFERLSHKQGVQCQDLSSVQSVLL